MRNDLVCLHPLLRVTLSVRTHTLRGLPTTTIMGARHCDTRVDASNRLPALPTVATVLVMRQWPLRGYGICANTYAYVRPIVPPVHCRLSRLHEEARWCPLLSSHPTTTSTDHEGSDAMQDQEHIDLAVACCSVDGIRMLPALSRPPQPPYCAHTWLTPGKTEKGCVWS